MLCDSVMFWWVNAFDTPLKSVMMNVLSKSNLAWMCVEAFLYSIQVSPLSFYKLLLNKKKNLILNDFLEQNIINLSKFIIFIKPYIKGWKKE